MTKDEEVLAAAVLHDVPEECDININEITKLFGKRVGELVDLETEPKYPDLSKSKSWILRKQDDLNKLKQNDDIGFKMMFLSDKLSNIRAIYRIYLEKGLDAFNMLNFNDIESQAWFYYEILDNISELNETEAYKEYEKKLDLIFKNVKRADK